MGKTKQRTEKILEQIMKKIAMLLTVSLLAAGARGDLWTYDFGTGTGSFTTSSGSSTTFLPQPTTGGGDDFVRVASGGGGLHLENPGDATVGSGSELRMTASTGASVNKFSIYDYTAAKAFNLSFNMKLSGSSSGNGGTWSLFLGDGARFADGNTFAGDQTFSGVRWVATNGNVTTTYRTGNGWSNTVFSGDTPFAQDQVYEVKLFGNNEASGSLSYSLNSSSYSVAAGRYDIWVGNTRYANIIKAGLASDANIDSFMFYGEGSANVYTIRLDDITYANVIPEPGTLGFLAVFGGAMAARRRMRRRSAA